MANYKKLQVFVQEHLSENEEVLHSVFGAYECTILGTKTVRNGILCVSKKRVLFFAKKMGGYDLESFPLENISSIEMSKGLLGHSITFFASGNKVTMKMINKGEIEGFINYTRDNMGKKVSAEMQSSSADIPQQIKQLSDLKDQGILTEDEFTQKKQELLSKM